MNRYTSFYCDSYPSMITKIPLTYDFKVLDLGAGDGATLYALRNTYIIERAKEVIAVELDYNRLMKIVELGLGFNCIVADATDLPPVGVDLIITNQVIEHIPNEDKFIDEMYRVLNPNGWVYLSTVFKKPFNFGYYWADDGRRVLDKTHVREYMDDSLKTRLRQKFFILKDKKSLQWFAITDFLLARICNDQFIYERNFIWRWLRRIKLPILGYYNWEMLLWRK